MNIVIYISSEILRVTILHKKKLLYNIDRTIEIKDKKIQPSTFFKMVNLIKMYINATSITT